MSLLASALFGLAIVPRNGAYDNNAVAIIVSGILVLSLVAMQQFGSTATIIGGPAVVMLLSVIWVVLFGMAWAGRNDVWLLVSVNVPWTLARPEQTFMLVLLCAYLPALIAPQLRETPMWRHVRFGLFACAVLVASWHLLQASPHPSIDVWELQQSGAEALVNGDNPYRVVGVPDTGVRADTVVPYAYPPVQLYATLPAFLLTGDVRYAMVVAVVLTGVVLRLITLRAPHLPSLAQDAPALFLWLTPKLFLIIEQAWIDPVGLALVCLAVWAHAARRPALAALLFGLAFGSKQTMIWLIPLVGVLVGFSRRQWFLALGVAAATVLPFVLWDSRSLYSATVTFVNDLPTRSDALTLLNWYYFVGGPPPAPWPGPLGAILVVVWAIRLVPRSISSFTATAALTYGLFFALNKIAFANYYFLVLGLAALSAAAALLSSDDVNRSAVLK